MITEQEFLALIAIEGIPPGSIAIHFNSSNDTILGFVIYNTPKTPETLNLVSVLEQLEQITLIIPSSNERVTLTVVSQQRFDEYFYYQVVPYQSLTTLVDQSVVENNQVSLSPFIINQKFNNNDYNVIFNNILVNRNSFNLKLCDRTIFSITPLNLNQILSGTAQPAQIPNSNYTTTGWKNARYNGSETNDLTYGNIPSALRGAVFQGEIYSNNTNNSIICSQSFENRFTELLLHTGPNLDPDFSFNEKTFTTLGNISNTQTQIVIKGIGTRTLGLFTRNDILRVTSGSSEELMRFKNFDKTSNTINVQRGVFGSTPISFGAGVTGEVVNRTQIFRFIGNQIVLVDNSKIWVANDQNILQTDFLGLVYTSSSCVV